MSREKSTCDVFLSASPFYGGVVEVVRRTFEEAGLVVFSSATIRIGSKWADAIREAIAESRAFVVLLTPNFVNSSKLAMEYGGAWAWNKPIYLLLESLSLKDVPPYLKPYKDKAVPIAKLAEVVESVIQGAQPLPEQECELLAELYADLGVPADQLAMRPDALEMLMRSFNKAAASKLSAERILQEVVRLRKQGQLPRLRPSRRRPERKA